MERYILSDVKKNDDTLMYVGSTTQPLLKRWYQHTLVI